jgi:hypothetical protein
MSKLPRLKFFGFFANSKLIAMNIIQCHGDQMCIGTAHLVVGVTAAAVILGCFFRRADFHFREERFQDKSHNLQVEHHSAVH